MHLLPIVLLMTSITQCSLTDDPISTHILDTTSGLPAAGVEIKLSKDDNGEWTELATK